MEIKIFDITKSVLLVLAFVILIFYGKTYLDTMIETNRQMTEQIIQITDNAIGLTGTQANKAEFEKLKKELEESNNKLLAAVKEQQKTTKETLDEIGIVKTEVEQTRKLYEASTKVYDKPGKEEHHYFYKEIFITNKDGKNAKVAWVMFYPNRSEDKQWKYGTFPITSETTVIETDNADGTINRYAQVEVKDKEGIEIPISVNEIKWEKIPLKEKRFFGWNPRIAMAAMASDRLSVGLNFSMSSYGRTKVDMDWRFLTVSLSYGDESILVSAEPFSWNIGKVIPLVENAFVGPAYVYDFEDNTSKIGVQLSIPF